jgi:peroxiredoxin
VKIRSFVFVLSLLICSLSAYFIISMKNADSEPDPRHPITKQMEDESSKVSAEKLEFTYPDHTGKQFALGDFTKVGPVLLVFTLHDCPCSMEAQGLFNDIATEFKGKASVIGICRDKPEQAKAYIEMFKVNYPLLIDAKKETISMLHAKNSVYVALVDRNAKLVKMWPGYNKEMIAELLEKMAELCGIPAPKLDLTLVPNKPTSGCTL